MSVQIKSSTKETRLKRLLVLDRDMYFINAKLLSQDEIQEIQQYLRCSAMLALLSNAYAAQQCLRCSAMLTLLSNAYATQ